MNNMFYVYVYLDPRKPGKFSYPWLDVCFLYEPFYIGKAICNKYNYRMISHLRMVENGKIDNNNSHKSYRIKHILNEGFKPIVFKLKDRLDQSSAFRFECFYIENIGRYKLETGPLLNLTEGGEGTTGYKFTEEQKINMSVVQKISNENPDIKKRKTEATKRSHNTPEYHKIASDAMKKVHEDLNVRKNTAEVSKKNWNIPEYRENIIKKLKEVRNRPEHKEKNSRIQKEAQMRFDVKLKKIFSMANYNRRKNDLPLFETFQDYIKTLPKHRLKKLKKTLGVEDLYTI